ncbi:radical SAM protein [Candidatus Albibeggiatoa sp. nov. NOAA]|uniref:radical SAM protein n=1 Tax=Candidatus Albibeggiatoa sp. nov. NOAA TaxID=3162724 RepID=UPI0032FE0669|nr:SPASM domain-containing protein [Thiotrichaceae bacterium]
MNDFSLPELIEIEPIHTCNLRCIMCHVSDEKLTNTRIDIDRLFKNLCDIKGKALILGATHEPTMHPQFVELTQGLSERGANLWLTTNGSVIPSSKVDQIKDCHFTNIDISFDGITKETCESIRRNLKYEQALERILYFKNTVTSSNSRFNINYTILQKNIQEMLASTQFWEQHGFDHIQFIVMTLRNELLTAESPLYAMPVLYEELEKVSRYIIENNCKINIGSPALAGVKKLRETYPDCFVGNYVKSANPLSQIPPKVRDSLLEKPDFSIAAHMCRSPFAYARILYDGQVQLCMKFTIGNIYEQTFEEIWYGEQANTIREKLQNSPITCHTCEFYNYCIKCDSIDLNNEMNFYADGTGLKAGQKIPQLIPTPILAEKGFLGFNIIKYQHSFYAIPQSDDTFDIERVKNNDYVKGTSLKKVKQSIQQGLQSASPTTSKQSQTLTISQALNIATQSLQEGKLKAAERLCRQILQYSPNQPDALHLLGVIAHKAKYYQDAIKLIQQALAVNPSLLDAYYNLAAVYQSLAQYQKAKYWYEQGLERTFNLSSPIHLEQIINVMCTTDHWQVYKGHIMSYTECLQHCKQENMQQSA